MPRDSHPRLARTRTSGSFVALPWVGLVSTALTATLVTGCALRDAFSTSEVPLEPSCVSEDINVPCYTEWVVFDEIERPEHVVVGQFFGEANSLAVVTERGDIWFWIYDAREPRGFRVPSSPSHLGHGNRAQDALVIPSFWSDTREHLVVLERSKIALVSADNTWVFDAPQIAQLVTGDFIGRETPDLAWVSDQSGDIQLWEGRLDNLGAPEFLPQPPIGTDGPITHLVAGNFGDSDHDSLAVVTQDAEGILRFIDTGQGFEAQGQISMENGRIDGITSGRFDADGLDDLGVLSVQENALTYRTFERPEVIREISTSSTTEVAAMVVANLDGEIRDDLLLVDKNGGSLHWVLSPYDQPLIKVDLPTSMRDLSVGDLDGDTYDDIVVATENQILILFSQPR